MRELTRLVSKTPFFHGDMRVGAGAGLGGALSNGGSGRTLLDFAVEVGVVIGRLGNLVTLRGVVLYCTVLHSLLQWFKYSTGQGT